jgi:hypothetical protein
MNMNIPNENEEKESPECLEEFLQLYRRLSAWERFQVDLYIRWSGLQRRFGKITWDWLLFQWYLDEKLKRA